MYCCVFTVNTLVWLNTLNASPSTRELHALGELEFAAQSDVHVAHARAGVEIARQSRRTSAGRRAGVVDRAARRSAGDRARRVAADGAGHRLSRRDRHDARKRVAIQQCSAPPRLEIFLRELRNPDHVAHEAVALIQIAASVLQLPVVRIDGRIGAVEGAELAGNLAAVARLAERVVRRRTPRRGSSSCERQHEAVVPGVHVAVAGQNRTRVGSMRDV